MDTPPLSQGDDGFSIILLWLSPSDLWLYLRECSFYPWLLMAFKKKKSLPPSKYPLLIAFQTCLGAVWSLVGRDCVRCFWTRLWGTGCPRWGWKKGNGRGRGRASVRVGLGLALKVGVEHHFEHTGSNGNARHPATLLSKLLMEHLWVVSHRFSISSLPSLLLVLSLSLSVFCGNILVFLLSFLTLMFQSDCLIHISHRFSHLKIQLRWYEHHTLFLL